MKNLYNIGLLLILFLGNVFINNYNLYFSLIYISLAFYHAFICKIIIKNIEANCIEIRNYIFISILLTIITYFFICDPNPFFCIIVFYTFYPNFIKAVLIIIIHSYVSSTYIKNLIINHNSSRISIYKLKRKIKFKYKSFFLSNIFIYIKKKNNIIIFISGLIIFIIFDVILFLNRTFLWVYLNPVNKTLPHFNSKNTTFYITSNIINMEKNIDIYLSQMKKLITYLGESNTIVSIVENGDSTDNTKTFLEEFRNYLDGRKILNKFILNHEIDDPRKTNYQILKYTYLRIDYYSKLRNKCLDFLYELPNIDFNNTIILFFNDIVFYYEDIINLLSTNNEDFDAVCGLDMFSFFYDRWVTIDLDGKGTSAYFPYFRNKEAQDLVINHKPIRIFSCWNGVIAFKALPLKDKKVQFRYKNNFSYPIIKLNETINIYFESECTYFHIDLHSLGYTKKFINPDVRVSYEYKYLFNARYHIPSFRHITYSFWLYMKYFFKKRNKYMSNYVGKNIKLESNLKKWYLENKIYNI